MDETIRKPQSANDATRRVAELNADADTTRRVAEPNADADATRRVAESTNVANGDKTLRQDNQSQQTGGEVEFLLKGRLYHSIKCLRRR